MKRILFPTDFSDTAKNALQYAVGLAEALDARIHLMHVSSLSVDEASKIHPNRIGERIDQLKGNAAQKLKDLAAGFNPDLFEGFRVDYGFFAAQEIIDAARKEQFDLIVMGTKGVRNAIERLLGSTTSNTMMNSHCPVMAIPDGAVYHPVKRIAYATDFHPNDHHGVKKLMPFKKALSASILFVHVDPETSAESIETVAVTAKAPFSDFYIVNNPSVSEGLEAFIQQKDIQILALFVPRRRLWERLFHTSISKKLALHSHTPLLVFHE